MSDEPDLSHHEELNLIEQQKDLKAREDAAGGPDALVATLVKGVRRQGRILWFVTIGLIADVFLSALLAIIFVHVNNNNEHAKRTAETVAKNAVTLNEFCLSGNNFFRLDRAAWATVLNLPTRPVGANPGLTISQLLGPANVAYFNKFLDKTFKPRVCK